MKLSNDPSNMHYTHLTSELLGRLGLKNREFADIIGNIVRYPPQINKISTLKKVSVEVRCTDTWL